MLTMFTLYQLNGSLRIEIESGRAGQPVKKSQQQHSSIPSPEPNAKWKGFGSPSPVQSQTTSPSLSGSSRRHSHQRSPGSQGVISFSARYPTANAEVLQAQLDKEQDKTMLKPVALPELPPGAGAPPPPPPPPPISILDSDSPPIEVPTSSPPGGIQPSA